MTGLQGSPGRNFLAQPWVSAVVCHVFPGVTGIPATPATQLTLCVCSFMTLFYAHTVSACDFHRFYDTADVVALIEDSFFIVKILQQTYVNFIPPMHFAEHCPVTKPRIVARSRKKILKHA